MNLHLCSRRSKLFSFIVLVGPLALQTLAQSNAVAYNASYDELTATEVGVPITTYEELNYTNWKVFSVSPVNLSPSSSPPNHIDLNATIGSMSVCSTRRLFNLTGFYFGCTALKGESVEPVLVPCDVLVTGYSNKQQVIQRTYVFSDVIAGPMQNVTGLGEVFVGLVKVTFQLAPPVGPVLALDNLQYVMYDKF
ncbi:hypothetical protein BT96DRAFT_367295 [Gymnopus androsaceus JB14]|uniref:Uncharacterized protein n=1 Tax=Gymnopus androsaceus JB14 TaxID=1447944 RepID=A0A6A4IKZ6_9AGAR|nr:hypothetical protein BT96DRAFT_367295 [Gymnopus androsaceus JB14]